MPEDVKELAKFLCQNQQELDSQAQKCMPKLEAIRKNKDALIPVYTILHHTTVALTKANDQAEKKLKICSECFHFLVHNWFSGNHLPKDGLEKLIFQIVKAVSSRCSVDVVDALSAIIWDLLLLIQKQEERNPTVLAHVGSKIIRFGSTETKCSCHDPSSCMIMKMLKCKFYGHVLAFCGKIISATNFFVKTVVFMDSITKDSCSCHINFLTEAVEESLSVCQNCFPVCSPSEKQYVKLANNALVKFSQIRCLLRKYLDKCEFPFKLCIKAILNDLCENIGGMEDTFSDFSPRDEETSRKILCKVICDILNQFSKIPLTTSVLDWPCVLPIFEELCRQRSLMKNEILDHEVLLKVIILYSQIFQSSLTNHSLALSLSQCLKVVEGNLKSLQAMERQSLELIVDLLNNMCISALKNNDKERLQMSSALAKSSFNIITECKLDNKRQFHNCCSLISKSLRKQQEYEKAMAWCGETIFSLRLNGEDLRFMLNLWICGKVDILSSAASKSKYESITIADYIPENAERFILVESLMLELDLCRSSRQHPPTSEYFVLCRTLELSADGTSPHLVANSLLSWLLYSWQDSNVFNYHRTALDLSSACRLYRSCDVPWEASFIVHFAHFMCLYEETLGKIWKEKKLFTPEGEISSSLQFFPSSSAPERECLLYMVEILEESSCRVGDHMQYKDEVLQAYRVLILVLQLFREDILLMKSLHCFETVLRNEIVQDKIQEELLDRLYMTLIMTLCYKAKSFCRRGQYEEGLRCARDAAEVYSKFDKIDCSSKRERRLKAKTKLHIELKLTLASCLFYNSQCREARVLLSDVMNDDFISAERRRLSRTSVFASARAELTQSESVPVLIGEDAPLEDTHALNVALSSMSSCCSLAQQLCPGVCMGLECFDVPDAQLRKPTFGRKTKVSVDDIVFQFEVLEHLLSSIYHTAYLWLLSGDLRFAWSYITDGIALCRALCCPERELKFQLLIVKHGLLDVHVKRIKDDIIVTKDILNYISNMEMKATPPKRVKFYSNHPQTGQKEIDGDTEEALNNSSILEDLEDEDSVTRSTVVMDVTNVILKEGEICPSPNLKKNRKFKQPKFKPPAVFTHPGYCSCRLCKDVFLIKDQCQFAQMYAEYMEMTKTSAEAIAYLQKARSFINSYLNSKERFKPDCKGDCMIQDNVLFTEEIEIFYSLARIYLNSGDVESAKTFTANGINLLKGQPVDTRNFQVHASLYFLAGQLLLSIPPEPAIDSSPFIDCVIDGLAKLNASYPRKLDINGSLSSEIGNLKISSTSSNLKPLSAQVEKVSIGEISLQKSTESKRSVAKVEKTPRVEKSTGKTPRGKRTTAQTPSRSARKTPRNASKSSSGDTFTIFDDEATIDIKLGEPSISKPEDNGLPKPEIAVSDEELNPSKLTSTVKKKKSRRVVFSFSSDEDDNKPTIGGDSPPTSVKSAANKTPAPRTRSSRRIATRNVMAARKEAKKKHRDEEGPFYVDEETEEVRPTRRSTRKTKTPDANTKDCSESEDIETVREINLSNSLCKPVFLEESSTVFMPTSEVKYNLEDHTCDYYLQKAFELSTAAGDFYFSKLSSQLLAVHHHYHTSSDSSPSSSNCHASSIGVTLRLNTNVHLKACYLNILRMRRKEPEKKIDKDSQYHCDALLSMIRETQQHKVISSIRSNEQAMETIRSLLPSQWTVCIVSHLNRGNINQLMFTQLRKNREPLHLQLQGVPVTELLTKHQLLLENNMKAMKTKEKSLWWSQRIRSNKAFQSFILEFESQLFGSHRGILLGSPLNPVCKKELDRCVSLVVDAIKESSPRADVSTTLIEIFLQSWKNFSVNEKAEIVLRLLHDANCRPNESDVTKVACAFEQYCGHVHKHICKRGHVILILDTGLQTLPVESIPTLYPHSVSRLPSVDMLLWQLKLRYNASHCKANLENVSYVVNPKGDLLKTEQRFSDWFKSIQPWTGVVSRYPTKEEWLPYIMERDAFVFCGHGAGTNFMYREMIARRRSRACALLMGCSSGMLLERGVSEPDGPVLSYMISGSPCVLSCLWQVTDKDIDRYLAKCLTEWMKTGTSLTEVIRKAESACKLPRLNGSACVVYGLPVISTQAVGRWIESLPEHFKDLA